MISISESEWQVMQAVWSGPPKTLPEILSSLQATGWSKTTIQTYLARLVKKGALTTQRQGKGYLYYPALSQSQCQLLLGEAQFLAPFTNSFCHGHKKNLLTLILLS